MNESSAVGNIMDVTESNLQEVLQLSTEKLVLLFIGMGSDEASNQQLRLVEQLANGYDGKMVLAKLDAEQQQMVAQQLISQLRANAIPVHAFLHEGRPVQVLNGPQTKQALRGVIDPLTMSPAEQIKLQVDALIEAGMIEQALELLQKILQEEPDNHGLQVLQVNLLLELGRMDDARHLLAALPADAPGIAQPKAKLAFYEMVAEAPQRDTLEARLQEDENDHEARYQLAIWLVIADDIESALDNLLVIVRRDRAFREDGARLLMLKVFEQLGAGNAVAKRYRGKLFVWPDALKGDGRAVCLPGLPHYCSDSPPSASIRSLISCRNDRLITEKSASNCSAAVSALMASSFSSMTSVNFSFRIIISSPRTKVCASSQFKASLLTCMPASRWASISSVISSCFFTLICPPSSPGSRNSQSKPSDSGVGTDGFCCSH